jgi:hypothetical protein
VLQQSDHVQKTSIESKYRFFASFGGNNLALARSIWLALYGIAFVLLCNMALARSSGVSAPPVYGSLADPTYVILVVLTLVAGLLFAAEPILRSTENLSSRMASAALAASFVAALALAVQLWSFDLDDKWPITAHPSTC